MKTITICDEYDCPTISLLKGHHDTATFNKAFLAEGWEYEPWPDDYVSHEYWVHDPNGTWRCPNKNDPQAIPVTVVEWDGPKSLGPNPNLH